MSALRALLLASTVVVLGAAGSAAQTPAPAPYQLPPGLVRQNGVVMMAPISDSDAGGPPELKMTGERRVALVHFLVPGDHDLLSRAFDAADRGDWTGARGLADQAHDLVGRKLVEWRYLIDKNSGAPFGEISLFMKENPDWPDQDILRARAEKAMDANMDPRSVIAWFGNRDPETGVGGVRLGEALLATGSAARGRDLIQKAWIDGNFEPDQEAMIVQRHGDILTPDIDRQRLDRLLWRSQVSEARRELARVTVEAQRIAEARITLRTSSAAGERLLDKLPESAREDPGLVFDRAHMLREEKAVDQIPPLLVKAPTREMAKIAPKRWWDELNLEIREAVDQGSYRSAYAIAAANGVEPGTHDYSDAEFMAGWIALRYLKEPRTALAHFQSIVPAVTRPVSKSRAHYWEGRCEEELGDPAAAWQQYHLAALTPQTFYGQLALARIEHAPILHLTETSVDANGERADYDREEITHAIRVLADLGLESLLRSFSVYDADTYTDTKHIKLLAEDLTRMGYKEIALRVAKEASFNNVLLQPYLHPVIAVPGYAGPGTPPEPAFVLGIIRQETEFDPDAVSGAGAKGIMQVMPFTARHTASVAGIDYRPADLLDDPVYNMRLGMTELADNLADWSNSLVLTAAAYNAGPANVKKWIAAHGDPRDARVDPIDWIEQIPFTETREYVQRVIENTEVYRNRLAGHDQPLAIMADIYRPNAPQVKVLDYTPPATTAPASTTLPVPIPRPGGSSAS